MTEQYQDATAQSRRFIPYRYIASLILYIIGIILVVTFIWINHPDLLIIALGGLAILTGILLGLE